MFEKKFAVRKRDVFTCVIIILGELAPYASVKSPPIHLRIKILTVSIQTVAQL